MAAAKTKKVLGEIHPRQILPGHIIHTKETKTDEVVRSVSVVVHLANGYDEMYEEDEMVSVLETPKLPGPLPDNLMPFAGSEGE